MRHHPSCWNKVLAKLGFRRVPRPKHRAAFGGRLSRLETLESRQMMTVTVNTLADIVDSNPLTMSLREAIAHPTDNSIVFDSSLNGGRIVLTQGELSINKPITITGPGADKLAIDAAGASRVMAFLGAGNVSNVSGLTITGGNSTASGGGIYVGAQLKLTSVDVSNNVTSNVGGGIAVENGKLEVVTSTIHDNRAVNGGGGIGAWINAVEAIKIVQSTISNNVGANGGGVAVVSTHATPATASVLFSRSTVTQNTASTGAGGIGGGLYNDHIGTATVTSHGSIIAGNTAFLADTSDIVGSFSSASTHNVIGRPGATGLSSAAGGNRVGTNAVPLDPKLSPLDNHGGPTKTHVPLPDSPAIDAGGPYNVDYSPAVDQRGFDRRAERPAPNVFPGPENWEDIGAVELSADVGPRGDFNGDGRDDQLIFDETTRALNVDLGVAASGNYDAEAWGVMPSEVSIGSTFIAGDFNGDGRDDVLIKSGNAYHLAISDGSTFLVQSAALPTDWNANAIYASDFDGDGSDEILGGTTANTWSVAHYHDAFGLSAAVAVPSLTGFAPPAQQFFQDANRDGRADIITRANGGSWMVRLAGATTDGSVTFAAAADWNAWIGYGYDQATGKLDADKAMAKVIEEFSWVYNNVELELYAGFMKGWKAVSETKAGNSWEQAALLVKRLEDAGFIADIASGTVNVPLPLLRDWIGVNSAGLTTGQIANANTSLWRIVRDALDGKAVPLDAFGNDLRSADADQEAFNIAFSMTSIRFLHAWVRVTPVTNGAPTFDLDPSWKFKDRQAGVLVDLSQPIAGYTPQDFGVTGRPNRGMFDELGFIANAADNQLPLEWYEDQLMHYMSVTGQRRSLGEVAYDGPILQKQFSTLNGLAGAGAFLSGTVTSYDNFAVIARDYSEQLTHRMTLGVNVGDTNQSTYSITLPAPQPLPAYDGVPMSGGVTVPITASGVSSYGKNTANTTTASLSLISPYQKDGPLKDATASLVPIIDPNGTPAERSQQLAEVRSFNSHFANFTLLDFPTVGSTADPERWNFSEAAAHRLIPAAIYQYTDNTRLNFEVRQIANSGYQPSEYNPFVAVSLGVYDNSTGQLLKRNIVQISDLETQPFDAPSGDGWQSVSIPLPSLKDDNGQTIVGEYRLHFLMADNVIEGVRATTQSGHVPAAGQVWARNFKHREFGEGLYSQSPTGLYRLSLALTGNSSKTSPLNRTISANTWMSFTFRASTVGQAHYIGVDDNDLFDDSSSEFVTKVWGNYQGPKAYTDVTNEQTLYINLGAQFGLTGAQTKSISRIVMGTDDLSTLQNADSYFDNIQIYEEADFPKAIVNGQLELPGLTGVGPSRQYVAANNYPITQNTILEFDYIGSGTTVGVGWDSNSTPGDTTNANVETRFTWPYSGGGAVERIRIPLKGIYTGSSLNIANLILWQSGGRSEFSNIKLYESSGSIVGSFIKLSGEAAKVLPLPATYTITPRTHLQFTFKITSGTAGDFHGIGWDQDDNRTSGTTNEGLFYLAGSDPAGRL